MSDNKKAFPDPLRGGESSVINQAPHKEDPGMDLRDYFAAHAPKVPKWFKPEIEE